MKTENMNTDAVSAAPAAFTSPTNLFLLDPVPEYFGHKIRVLVDELNENAPWFVAMDLAKALVIGNIRVAVGRLEAHDKGVTSIYTLGGNQDVSIVSESGFYELVLGSRKKGAVAFKRWVCSSVLPSIRRFGRYEVPANADNIPLNIPDVMVDLVRTLPGVTEAMPDGTIRELDRRMHVYEYLEIIGAENLQHRERAILGSIARRLLHTYELPVILSWKPYDKNRHWTEIQWSKSGTYPRRILEMAYDEFLKGMTD